MLSAPLRSERNATTSLIIRESARVSVTINAIDMVLRDASTTVIASGSFDSSAVSQLAGSSRVPGGGALTVTCGVHYSVSQAGRAGVLSYTVRFTDDYANQAAQTVTVSVTAT